MGEEYPCDTTTTTRTFTIPTTKELSTTEPAATTTAEPTTTTPEKLDYKGFNVVATGKRCKGKPDGGTNGKKGGITCTITKQP
mmetsp:Transcript_126463/g.281950  ORF Transcript_126463/g.281950 Transcript_126463/m.281950 type:complete len:83 (+) Transcript_126463:1-249(+)